MVWQSHISYILKIDISISNKKKSEETNEKSVATGITRTITEDDKYPPKQHLDLHHNLISERAIVRPLGYAHLLLV